MGSTQPLLLGVLALLHVFFFDCTAGVELARATRRPKQFFVYVLQARSWRTRQKGAQGNKGSVGVFPVSVCSRCKLLLELLDPELWRLGMWGLVQPGSRAGQTRDKKRQAVHQLLKSFGAVQMYCAVTPVLMYMFLSAPATSLLPLARHKTTWEIEGRCCRPSSFTKQQL